MKDKKEYKPILMTREKIAIKSVLYSFSGFLDRSQSEQGIHEDNYDAVSDEIIKKLDFIKNTTNK